MIKLCNGRGQLGECLTKILPEKNYSSLEIVNIYHTWNVEDKSKQKQENEFLKFKNFVNINQNEKIIFISTYSEKEDYYVHFKQLSEAYLLSNHSKGQVIKLPTFIGKGICEKFKNGKAEPYGVMELISVQNAAKEVIKLVDYCGYVKSFRIKGEIVSAEFVKNLIDFSKK